MTKLSWSTYNNFGCWVQKCLLFSGYVCVLEIFHNLGMFQYLVLTKTSRRKRRALEWADPRVSLAELTKEPVETVETRHSKGQPGCNLAKTLRSSQATKVAMWCSPGIRQIQWELIPVLTEWGPRQTVLFSVSSSEKLSRFHLLDRAVKKVNAITDIIGNYTSLSSWGKQNHYAW